MTEKKNIFTSGKSKSLDDLLKVGGKKEKDPLADYRDRSFTDYCVGCEHNSIIMQDQKSLQKDSICRNCVVTAIKRGDVNPEPEESF